MSTSTSDLNSSQTAPGTVLEHSNRGNRRHNHRRHRGSRPYYQGNRGRYSNSNSREQTSSASRGSRVAVTDSSEPSISNGNPPPSDSSICFICAEPVQYYAVSECNHKFCHICSLRLRALYKNKNCAYCKTEQIKVIFTRKADKEFQEFNESDIPYFDEELNAYCEDPEMFNDIKILLGFTCPDQKCSMVYEGWSELKRHIRRDHRLSLCDICIRHKKIFTHEHSLFTYKGLDKHFREGDEVEGFKGHPMCQFCEEGFYGDDELYEHCRDKHEQCFICVRNGLKDNYYRDYNSLEEHFRTGHYLCENQECLEKKFVVFRTDIDLIDHEVNVHDTSLSGQRARQARRIETFFDYGDSHTRRGRRRSRERQQDWRTDDDGIINTDEITRQTQNLNLDSTSTANGTTVNARAIRPPPGFGVLSPDEAIESPENEVEIHIASSTPPPRMREEDFPTLSDAMRVTTGNSSGTNRNYSDRVKQKSKSADKKPADKQKPTRSIASSNRVETPPDPPQQPPFETTNKGKTLDFPPLSSSNQSTSSPSGGSNISNYRQSLSNIDSEISSRDSDFYQRVSTLLSHNPSKMDEFKSLTTAYINSILDASAYIELISPLFDKNASVGKVVSGLVETLGSEKKRSELLSAWNDHKVKKTADFPALESVHSPTPSMTNNSKSTPKQSARVLVIKSSTTRSGGTKASGGRRVWDKIAAIAESKIKEKNNSTFPSLAAAASSTSSNSDVWKGSVPKFVQQSSRNENMSSSLNNFSTATNITTFVRGRPTRTENDEFPELPSTPKSSYSQQKSKNNGSEKSAWGQRGTFTSILPDNNQNENDSEDDFSYSESAKEGGKKKKQKKPKNVILYVG